MTHVVLLNLVFFLPATCGAIAFVVVVLRVVLAADAPDGAGPDPARLRVPVPKPGCGGGSAGPDDLARSA
ncbi:MAG TPA: hypothetical protein VMJ49_11695 [Gaiellaceae bacterium]|nr:hypothetical protein [Gaiellaceae bacterium]